jgi:hypothetical protein
MSIMFFNPRREQVTPNKGYWNNQDIADFYRAVDILKQAGLNTEIDSGVTDEGDPWFVFIKPESGEVIAHFAQIDGQFIAVSSLNQEVYKGNDIRSIVDQMLDRHPMLLPQNKNSGRLLLHPTAALSAFLAAAFILTVDGVKASNLTDVISGVVYEGSEHLNNEEAQNSYSIRSETLKGMFADLTVANYNVAVLGAALIAHELAQNELDLAPHDVTDDKFMLLDIVKIEQNEETEVSVGIGSEHHRNLNQSNHSDASLESSDLELNDQDAGQQHPQDELEHDKGSYEFTGELALAKASDESLPALSERYDVFGIDGNSIFKTNYHQSHQIELDNQTEVNSVNEQFNTTSELDSDLNEDSFNTYLESVLQNIQGPSKIVPDNFRTDSFLGADSLGIIFNSAGEVQLVFLEELGSENLKNALRVEVFSPMGQLGPIKEPEQLQENKDLTYLSLEKADKGGLSVEPLDYGKPILGHSLNDSNNNLSLSDAIDVVFYTGGNAEISDFELGTDLLWFFVSPEELNAANNNINDQGDLVLDFGDTGTLTFLSIVPDVFLDSIA